MTFMNEQRKAEILRHPHILGLMVGFSKLTELHSQMILHIWAQTPGRFTSLQGHRGSFKTTSVTVVGIVWYLLWHPNARIALLQETWTVAVRNLRAIQKVMRHPAIQEVFRYIHGEYPKEVKATEGELDYSFKKNISKEPSVSAYGILQLPTGSHFDFILMDDVVTINDKISKTVREKHIYAIREVFTNIIDPGKTVAHSGTPWHKKDAWSITVAPKKYPVGTTDIFTPEQIAFKRSQTTATDWAINMELRHIADGEKPFSSPAAWAPFPKGIGRVVAHIDAKYRGTDTCGFTIMVKQGVKLHLTGKILFKHIMEEVETIITYLVHYNVRELFMETNGDKGLAADRIRAVLLERNIPCTVTDYHEKMNKHVKITGVGVPVWPYLIWDTATDPEFLDQTKDYAEGNEPDDGPDSWTSLVREAYGDSNSEWRFLYHNSED